MREERGQIAGNLTINELFTLWGSVSGDVTVVNGGKVYVRGAIYGKLIVQDGGRVHIFGNVNGDLIVHPNAKVIVSGMLGGDAINRGGRLFVEGSAIVVGKVKTRDEGETKIDRHARVGEDPRRAV